MSSSLCAQEITYPTTFEIVKNGTAIALEDYATLPHTGRGGSISDFGPHPVFNNQLSRANFLRSEPANAPLSDDRFFVCDSNRDLFILDKASKTFTSYINFQAVFPNFYNSSGYSGGLIAFEFDPAYAANGIFYTVHWETGSAGATPITNNLPGLNLSGGYSLTPAINPPEDSVLRQNVIVEWTDTNISNATFEGTAREIMRIGMGAGIHPVGDFLFNPLAQPFDDDYRNLYIAVGDGAAGEQNGPEHPIPQRLDAVQGKILRITPDLNLRPADELGPNGRYRIPTTGSDPNPFTSGAVTHLAGLRKEIFAYGFRNCHRLTWDPASNLIIGDDIGLHSWEEVNIIQKGGNYGYAEREGPEELFIGGANHRKTGSKAVPPIAFPSNDVLTVNGLTNPVTPIYPVAVYSHQDGDGIANGFVYRGSFMPQFVGKYIFADIPNARIFYCDRAEIIAVDDGDRNTVAAIHEIQIVFNGAEHRLFDIVAVEFDARGGTAGGALPGGANSTNGSDVDGVPYGGGRADLRLAQGGDGEIYVISKSDSTIRKMVGALSPPLINIAAVSNGTVTLSWPAISNRTYRVQYKPSITDSVWTNLPGDVVANSDQASKGDSTEDLSRFYRVIDSP